MIIGKSAARLSRRNVGDRPKTMCRQKLRNEVPEAGKPALSCRPEKSRFSYHALFSLYAKLRQQYSANEAAFVTYRTWNRIAANPHGERRTHDGASDRNASISVQ